MKRLPCWNMEFGPTWICVSGPLSLKMAFLHGKSCGFCVNSGAGLCLVTVTFLDAVVCHYFFSYLSQHEEAQVWGNVLNLGSTFSNPV